LPGEDRADVKAREARQKEMFQALVICHTIFQAPFSAAAASSRSISGSGFHFLMGCLFLAFSDFAAGLLIAPEHQDS
jgi:hypothetical protein